VRRLSELAAFGVILPRSRQQAEDGQRRRHVAIQAIGIQQSGTSSSPKGSITFATCAGSNGAFLANRERSLQMSKSATFPIAAIAALVAGMAFTASSNAQSTTSDAAYCQALVKASRWAVTRGAACR